MADETPEETSAEAAESQPEASSEQPEETAPAETTEEVSSAATTEDAADTSAEPTEESASEEGATDEATTDEDATDEDATAAAESDQASDAESSEQATAELTLGSGAPAEEPSETIVPKLIRGRIDKFGVAMGTGRRKTSVARVRVKDGNGKLAINGKILEEYFAIERDRQVIEAPLKATDCYGKVDVWVRVNGGGTTGQAGAIVLGIARALQVKDPTLHGVLSGGGFLTRDSRMVERKKYGYKKARKSFQFSKR